ncbi:MAG: CPBP family intramembrane glutamic endopeptidase [Tannerellaceae bacterium]
MQTKGIYSDHAALFQLIVLLIFILAGAVFSSLIGMGVFFLLHGSSLNMMDYPDAMRWMQFISAVGTFLLPALAIGWTCSKHPSQYLYTTKYPSMKALLLTLASMLLLSPAINLTGLLNKQLVLPSFLAPIETWMRAQEALAEQLTGKLLLGGNALTLVANLIVIALVAGVTEEFLFRGALGRIIGRWTTSHHWVIWVTAFLFSTFHLQFFGFLPRLLLGAYFGYLLYWSKSIWLPVMAHFFNNAFAVCGMSDRQLKDNEFFTGDITYEHLLPYTLFALLALALFFACQKGVRQAASHR